MKLAPRDSLISYGKFRYIVLISNAVCPPSPGISVLFVYLCRYWTKASKYISNIEIVHIDYEYVVSLFIDIVSNSCLVRYQAPTASSFKTAVQHWEAPYSGRGAGSVRNGLVKKRCSTPIAASACMYVLTTLFSLCLFLLNSTIN